MSEYMGIIWLIGIIGFAVLEASTVQFVSIWFAGGSLVALIMFLFGASVSTQVLVFAIASAVLLILTRPFVKKLSKNADAKTNLDSAIGKKAVVTKETDDFGDYGETKIDGKFWTIKSSDGEKLSEGDVVYIEKIEGVKLIVRK